MNKKVETIDLKGKDYAQVSDRVKAFREDCPNGLIKTSYEIRDDGQIVFEAKILKDKSKAESAESFGHALGSNDSQKAFEKLETIAIGRALALLGYMASGEIASSEEMEEFYFYKNEKLEEKRLSTILDIQNAKTISKLKSIFISSGMMSDEEVIFAKDVRKEQLNENN